MPALGLASEPLPLWWSTDFINSSPPGNEISESLSPTNVGVRRRPSTYVDVRRRTSTYVVVRRRTSTIDKVKVNTSATTA